MNMFKTFERRVGDVFGASPRGHVAPFSFRRLAKRAARELEAETYVIDGINTAPALITVLVSAEDDALMRPIYAQLTEELSALIEAEAASKDYVFVGKPLSRFMVDQSLKPGRFAVFANNVDARSLEQLRAEERAFLAGEDVLGGAASVSAHAASHSAGAHASGAISTPVSTKSAQDHINLDDSAAGLSVLPPEYDQPLSPEDDLVVGVAAIPDIAFEQPEQENAGIADESGLDALPKIEGLDEAAVPSIEIEEGLEAKDSDKAPAHGSHAAHSAPTAEAHDATPHCVLIDRQSGRTYAANAPRTIVGRDRSSGGIVLRDPNVSRHHAELTYADGQWTVRDLNSTNGTLVNGVDVDTALLTDGDLITFGLLVLEFRGDLS